MITLFFRGHNTYFVIEKVQNHCSPVITPRRLAASGSPSDVTVMECCARVSGQIGGMRCTGGLSFHSI